MNDRLEQLRRVPGLWVSIIPTTRIEDELAWTLNASYGTDASKRNVQYTFRELDDAVAALETHLRARGALEAKTKPKLKLRRTS